MAVYVSRVKKEPEGKCLGKGCAVQLLLPPITPSPYFEQHSISVVYFDYGETIEVKRFLEGGFLNRSSVSFPVCVFFLPLARLKERLTRSLGLRVVNCEYWQWTKMKYVHPIKSRRTPRTRVLLHAPSVCLPAYRLAPNPKSKRRRP